MLLVGILVGLVSGCFIARFRMPRLHDDAGDADVLLAPGDLAHPEPEHRRTCPELHSPRQGRHRLGLFRREADARDPAPRHPAVRHLLRADRVALASPRTSSFSRTVFGRQVYAIGNNANAAEISGVRCAVPSSSSTSSPASAPRSPRSSIPARLEGGRPTIGGGSALLDIIGATVIGGTSLAAARARSPGPSSASVFFVLLSNTLNYMRLSAFHIDVVKGAIILAAALLDVPARAARSGAGRPMSDAILELDGIGKSFFGVHGLADVTLRRRGRVLGLVGQNGAGKSTLMNIIGGVLPPDTGTMRLDAAAYAPASPREPSAAGIAFIHQELNLFTNLTIAENIFISRFPAARRAD